MPPPGTTSKEPTFSDAIAAFKRVLAFKDSPYYDRALYKLAWSYYRDNRFPEAVREFDNLVKYADSRKAAGQKVGCRTVRVMSSTRSAGAHGRGV